MGTFLSISAVDISQDGSASFLGVMLRPDEVQFPSGLCLDEKDIFLFHNLPEASRMLYWMTCGLIACPYLIFRGKQGHGVELMRQVVQAG